MLLCKDFPVMIYSMHALDVPVLCTISSQHSFPGSIQKKILKLVSDINNSLFKKKMHNFLNIIDRFIS